MPIGSGKVQIVYVVSKDAAGDVTRTPKLSVVYVPLTTRKKQWPYTPSKDKV